MNIKNLTTHTIILFIVTPALVMGQQEKKVTPPKKIDYEEKTLRYNPSWQDKETYIETDLGTGKGNDVIISFIATYSPKSEIADESSGNTTESSKEEDLPILENYAFYQIYSKNSGGRLTLVKTIHGMDQLGDVKIIPVEKNKPKAIAISSPGGDNYIDLSIYQWQDGGFRLIFNTGGSEKPEIDTQQLPATIHIKDARGLQEMWIWDNTENKFKKIIEK